MRLTLCDCSVVAPRGPRRARRAVSGLLLGLLGLLVADVAEARVRWSTPGSYRLRFAGLSAFPLDDQGTDNGQRLRARHRLRIEPQIAAGPVFIQLGIDVLTGQIFGDPNPIGADFAERRHGDPTDPYDGWTTVEPRLGWAELVTAWATVEAGQMPAHWGMGLLDADGQDADDGRWVERLGDPWNGDIVDRARVSVRPLRGVAVGPIGDVTLSLGGDYVYQDDLADALSGDAAWRVVGALSYPADELSLGVYAVYRSQVDDDADTLERTTVDLHGRWELPLFLIGAAVRVEGELLFQTGRTDKIRPASSPDGVDLYGLGWVSRAEIAWDCPRIATGLEVGYASGDADPFDDAWRYATLDPDHRVGLVLFPDVIRQITARSADRVVDQALVGESPQGAELLPTDGGVRNALYVNPGVTWRPGRWTLTGMALLAWAAEPFVDPYSTFASGGAPRNHRGANVGRFYGTELSMGVAYAFDISDVFAARIGLQAGGLLPGAALTGEMSDAPIGKAVGRLDLSW